MTRVNSRIGRVTHRYYIPKDWNRTCEMARWIRVLATKPGELGSVPATHMGKMRTNFHKLFYDLHKWDMAFSCIYKHKQIKII